MTVYEFQIIDEMWRANDIRAHVAEMSPVQRRAHIGLTATLDVAYPFAYAALFGGWTLAGFPSRKWLAVPILLCIPLDLAEGLSQIFILMGQDGWVGLKTVVTPLKLVLFVAGVLIGSAGGVRVFLQRRAKAG